jgi:hypothetical protein
MGTHVMTEGAVVSRRPVPMRPKLVRCCWGKSGWGRGKPTTSGSWLLQSRRTMSAKVIGLWVWSLEMVQRCGGSTYKQGGSREDRGSKETDGCPLIPSGNRGHQVSGGIVTYWALYLPGGAPETEVRHGWPLSLRHPPPCPADIWETWAKWAVTVDNVCHWTGQHCMLCPYLRCDNAITHHAHGQSWPATTPCLTSEDNDNPHPTTTPTRNRRPGSPCLHPPQPIWKPETKKWVFFPFVSI